MESEFKLRSYQSEMLEESLKRNVIVAMDTGSGKTHIALARARIELERCSQDELVWLLAPSVALCNQHLKTIQLSLPGFESRLLTGAENVDSWTEQRKWDAILLNIRIVISTYDVLKDALAHGFVRLSRLALLVVDEAHHCVKDSGLNRIMREHYHPARLKGDTALPPVLGLSASPVISARAHGLSTLEANLNSTVILPKRCRTDFLRHVHRPILQKQTYSSSVTSTSSHSAMLSTLDALDLQYDLQQDPYVKGLFKRVRNGPDQRASRQLEKVYVQDSTYCRDQLRHLSARAREISEQLGLTAAEDYIEECIIKFNTTDLTTQQWHAWAKTETGHLKAKLQPLLALKSHGATRHCSDKATRLVTFLRESFSGDTRGLIFVQERAMVAALANFLRATPELQHKLRIGAFIGMSSSNKRKGSIVDILETRGQDQALADFRSGALNLLVCTSVLEEGIDVSDCDLVICFDSPMNLKGYIQRRGRARKERSKYILLTPDNHHARNPPNQWDELEQRLKEEYENEMREAKVAHAAESQDEKDDYVLASSQTGARLTTADAVGHLYHFCATLNTGQYVDARPEFTFEYTTEGRIQWVTAEVVLPLAVEASLRQAKSARKWLTERQARKDAAFQAYSALYKGGLIGENLLPLRHASDSPGFNISDRRPSMMQVRALRNVWISAVQKMQEGSARWHKTLIAVRVDDGLSHEITVLTPTVLPPIAPYPLYWNESSTYIVTHTPLGVANLDTEDIEGLRQLSNYVFSRLMLDVPQDLFFLVSLDGTTTAHETKQWLAKIKGARPATEVIRSGYDRLDPRLQGLVQSNEDNALYLLKGVQTNNDTLDDHLRDQLTLVVTRFPKRFNFLAPIGSLGTDRRMNDSFARPIPLDASCCTIENMPASFALMARFMPSLIIQIERLILADLCREEVLGLPTQDGESLALIRTALTSTAASATSNYERFEFFGDCILKLCTSIGLAIAHADWPESYLTAKKGSIVSNGNLARASMTAGFDRYIIRSNTGLQKLPEIRVHKVLKLAETEMVAQDRLSSKTLADVIESFIGLAYVQGGIDNALATLKKLLPAEEKLWPTTTAAAYGSLWAHAASTAPTGLVQSVVQQVEEIIGYRFTNPNLLLEALTHASYQQPLHQRDPAFSIASYQRLEFLGDAVLDFIVSRRLYYHPAGLLPLSMHTVRSCVVNADILAFLASEHTSRTVRYEVVPEPSTGGTRLEEVEVRKALWQFMRHSSSALSLDRQKTAQAHQRTREKIIQDLQYGTLFPWYDVHAISADKSMSDIVESTIAAIFIDSKGSYDACEAYIERLGVLPLLDRLIRDKVDCVHPKERLGRLAGQNKVAYIVTDLIFKKEDTTMYENSASASDNVPSLDGRYTFDLTSASSFNITDPYTHTCRVFISGNPVGEVAYCRSRLGAQTLAAARACVILRREMEKAGLKNLGLLVPGSKSVDQEGEKTGVVEEEEEEEGVDETASTTEAESENADMEDAPSVVGEGGG